MGQTRGRSRAWSGLEILYCPVSSDECEYIIFDPRHPGKAKEVEKRVYEERLRASRGVSLVKFRLTDQVSQELPLIDLIADAPSEPIHRLGPREIMMPIKSALQ